MPGGETRNKEKYRMKIELEFDITKTTQDTIEGTWHGNIDDDAVYLHHYTELLIKHHIASLVENIDAEYGTGTHAWNIDTKHINEKCGVSLFEENGKEIDPESMHGIFVAYKYGIPA